MPGSKITGFMRSTVKMTGKVGSYMKIQDLHILKHIIMVE